MRPRDRRPFVFIRRVSGVANRDLIQSGDFTATICLVILHSTENRTVLFAWWRELECFWWPGFGWLGAQFGEFVSHTDPVEDEVTAVIRQSQNVTLHCREVRSH